MSKAAAKSVLPVPTFARFGETIRVVDGDTIYCRLDLGFFVESRVEFRLARINAPEIRSKNPERQKKALAAKDFLYSVLFPKSSAQSAVTPAKKIIVEAKKKDTYGRWIAEIWVDGQNVSDLMVASGHAEVYLGGKVDLS